MEKKKELISCPKCGYVMQIALHASQKKLIELHKQGVDINGLTLRDLGKLIEVQHPQKVKHHLERVNKLLVQMQLSEFKEDDNENS